MGDFKNSITAAEINLADDAPWKKIQKNTFTRWCNEHLKTVDLQINDLKFDLSDGLVLISLLEVLSHKRMFRKYHTRPTFRQLKLDNVSVALEFLDLEKVKLVSIDSKAIVDGNMKLILGLVWTLIQHYSISTSVWEDEVNDSVTKLTPEMRLLGWIRNKVPELPITNFNQDWQDGKALGALVDGLAPGLCPDWESWDTVHRVSNTKEAMQQAHDWLGIPQLIAPEEILDPSVDEQSVMTYLSLFPKARLKPGAPLKAKKVPKPKACRVTGRGLQSRGVRVGQLVEFKVDTRKAGPGNLEVHMSDPSGNKVFVMQKDVLEGVYTFEYKPSAEGVHTVDITWVGQHIPKSPFKIHVGPEAGPQKIRAWGPGLEGGIMGSSADFLVESINADSGLLAFAIEGPSPAKIECNDQNDGSCLVRFWPTEAGEYAVHVMCDDEEIQDSPFMASIKPKRKDFYPDKVKVHGPGVSQTGCIVNNQTEFTVDTRHAGEGELKVYAQRADGECVNLSVSSEESGIFVCSYIPSSLSKHTITVAWGGLMVPGSPFIVIPCRIKIKPCSPVWFKPDGSEIYYSDEDVDLDQEPPENIWPGGHGGLVMNISNPSNLPADATKVEAHGPGLKEGLLGEQAEFIIDTRGAGSGRLDIRVDGPCQVTLQCLDNQDGTCTVFYLPTEPGNYKIKVLFDNSHIPGSPFEAVIQRPLDPSKVLVTGPGLIQGNVGEPSIVNIDCTVAGCGDLLVEAISDSGSVAQTEVKKNKDGTYTVVYVPLTAGIYMLLLKYGGEVVPDFPAKVTVNPKIYKSCVKVPRKGRRMGGERDDDLSQVVADGVGLLQGLMGCPNMFSVNTRGASVDDLGITVEGPSECEVTCKDNGEGLYHVEYIPSVPGQYEITITCGGNSIPGSPFIASVKDVAIIADSEISTACRQSEICDQIPDAAAVIFLQGMTELTEVTDNGDGIYTVSSPASIEGDSCMEPQSPDECSSPISCEKLPNCDGVRELALAPAVNMAENIGPDVKDGICARTSPTFTIGCSRSGAAPETVAEVKLDGTIKHLELTNRVGKPDGEKVMPTTDSARGNEGVFNKEKLLSPALEEQVCDKAPPLTNSCSVNSVTPDTVANGTIKNDGAGTSKIAFSPNMERCHTGMVKYTSEETFENLFEFQQGLSGDNTEPKIYSQVPQSFTISCSEAGMPPESVVIITPNGITELMEIKDNTDGTYTVNYSPSAEGSHSLMVKYADDDLYSNLMRFHVQPTTHSVWKDENIINKSEVSSRRLEEDICAKIPQTFTTDCSTIRGTSETVTMVSPSGTTHLAEVVNNEKEICALNHTPSTEESQYSALRDPNAEPFLSISQKFSSQDSSCCNSLENKVVDRDSIAFGPINHAGFISCDIAIPSDLCEGGITGEVVTPSGVTAQPAISDNGDGTISLKFDPSEEGLHHLLIKSSGTDGPDLPLQYYANSLANRRMMAYGCGLMYGIANETATFTICQEDSASGDLDITVEGPSETEVCCFDNEDGTCTVTYLPTKPGDYEIQVRHNDMPIQGSPFQAKIADGNLRRSVVKLGSAVDFTLDISEEDISQLSASVMSPTGIDVPCLLKAQPDSHLGISFIPREAGEHSVSIMKGGGHVKNSPISLSISQAEIGDAGKVKAFGPGLHTGQTYHLSDFMVDTWDAGYGGLTVVIEGPSNVDVHTEELEHGTCKISYCPIEAGTYIISIKFSNDHIPGSPFKAVVIDSGLIQERIEYNQKPAIFYSTGNECSLAFKIPGVDAETLSAHVRAPSGTLAEAKIVASGGDNYAVSFVAEVIGVYDVIVSSLGQPIPGCPFQYTVGPLGEGESGKVQVLGSGLQRTQASVPGDYEVSVLLNKDHVSESPFHVSVSKNLTQGQMEQNVTDYDLMSKGYGEPSQPEMEINLTSDGTAEPVFLSNASKIISHGPGLSKGFLGQKNTFYVDCSKAGRNLLFVGMHGPNVPCERVSIIHMGGHQYRINYVVKERGKYILAVKWGDEHIPGSPFHISVL